MADTLITVKYTALLAENEGLSMRRENMRFINKVLGTMASDEDKLALEEELGTRRNQIKLARKYLTEAFPLDTLMQAARGASPEESERKYQLVDFTRGIFEHGGAAELLKPSVIMELAFNEVLRQRGLKEDNTDGIE